MVSVSCFGVGVSVMFLICSPMDYRLLSEIESDNLTVSNSEIMTFDFHCL